MRAKWPRPISTEFLRSSRSNGLPSGQGTRRPRGGGSYGDDPPIFGANGDQFANRSERSLLRAKRPSPITARASPVSDRGHGCGQEARRLARRGTEYTKANSRYMLWSVIVLAASAVITALATIFSAWLARSSPPPRLGALSRHLVEPIRQRGECGGVASRRIMADTAASRWIQP